MSTSYQFDWVDFYKELAAKLPKYKDRRQELIQLVQKIYAETGINMPTLQTERNRGQM